MFYRDLNTRYIYLRNVNHEIRPNYDYKQHGLINKLLPVLMKKNKNKTTKYIFKIIDAIFIYLMGYVDELKNFKNYFFHKY